jgi:hypothetical protein
MLLIKTVMNTISSLLSKNISGIVSRKDYQIRDTLDNDVGGGSYDSFKVIIMQHGWRNFGKPRAASVRKTGPLSEI